MSRHRHAPRLRLRPADRLPRSVTAVDGGFLRLAAVVAVGALGAGTLAATSPAAPSSVRLAGERSRVAAAAPSVAADTVAPGVRRHDPAPHVPHARPTHRAVAHPARAAKSRTHAHAVHAPTRYIPHGTGMWIYQWHHTNGGNAASVVRQARSVGLSTLYLRTGSSWDGFSGGHALRSLLHAAAGTSVHVVAWDFPRLRHPRHDALRLARAAHIRVGSHHARVSAVAPDIETPAEGTFNAAWRVRAYLTALRRHLPKGVTILTAVPWPSRYRIADYPYRAVAAHSDVLVPMAYWYNNSPGLVTARSITYLRRFHRPVQPVGQGYDGKLDVPSLRHNHLNVEVPRFFRTAHAHGVWAVSLWSWQAAPPAAWRALAQARGWFHHPAPAAHHH